MGDDTGKSRIMCLGWECRCLRRMKRLSRSWGWAGCIRDSMEWWGIRVQWNGNNSSTSFCLRSSNCRTDLSIHFQPSQPTTIWMFFLVSLTLSLVYSTMRQTTESVNWHCGLRLFKLGHPLHTGFEPRSPAWLACSTGQSTTTYTTVLFLIWWFCFSATGSLMGGEILRSGCGVVMSWWVGSGMLGGES